MMTQRDSASAKAAGHTKLEVAKVILGGRPWNIGQQADRVRHCRLVRQCDRRVCNATSFQQGGQQQCTRYKASDISPT